jgi:ADP-ribose pyrophosphatase YjhB (NUDIX family)
MKKGIDFTGICVIFLCHDGEGNFAMAKRSQKCRDEQGTWDVGAGGVKFGEKVEDTVKREVLEEYGATALEQEFLGFRDVHRTHNNNKTHWIALEYLVLVNKAEVKNGEPDMLDEVGWFTIDTLPSPLHSQVMLDFKVFKKRLLEMQ